MRSGVGIAAGLLVPLLAGALLAAQAPGGKPAPAPSLLVTRCGGCHGAGVQQGGLRLDYRQGALLGGDSGPAVLPGRAQESELLRRVTHPDPAKRMPPGAPLTAAEVALLRAWVEEGAPWPGTGEAPRRTSSHWAFQPIRPAAPPRTRTPQWVLNPIDAFVLSRLEAKRLRPSPPADRRTLLRRLSLDLLGLLPSPEEVDAFVADRSPDAYARQVERLLASPHYGERWARHWLDQARYADSNGFTIDSARSIWPYRDWVIRSLNEDLPFDQFGTYQLAGDLLPNAGREHLVATGFHRNTLVNEEGGTDPEQFRVEAVVDRTNTTGTVFLGLTVACAQCHTHKYDPITQREYYQLYAFFNDQDEPTLPLPGPEIEAKLAELKTESDGLRRELERLRKSAADRQAAWEQKILAAPEARWTVLRPQHAAGARGTSLTPQPDGSLLAGTEIPPNDTYVVTFPAPREAVGVVRLEALIHPSLPRGGPGFGRGNFVLTEFELLADGKPVRIARAEADHSQKNYPVTGAIDGNPRTGWAINVGPGEGSLNQDRTALFVLADPVPVGAKVLTVRLAHDLNQRYLLGRFRVSTHPDSSTPLSAAAGARLRELLSVPPQNRTAEQKAQASVEFARADPELAGVQARLDSLREREAELTRSAPTTLILRERAQPRDTRVQFRGDFLRLGGKVEPEVPSVLPPLGATGRRANRLDLARWMFRGDNPLTARVAVNRVWQAYFGTGLVETENDFGVQGTPPSHPELLDWLADWWRRPASQGGGGWRLKALHRLIVTSNTYKQSSADRPDLHAADPANRLLGRQSRLRLEAEVLRDVCLSASGLLSRKIGGPSVFPPQPAGLDLFTQNRKNWRPSTGEDRYRRGLYTFAWRSSPFAFFAAFDAPSGNTACTRRARSNTPLAALMLANDSSIVEMAQALGRRTVREAAGEEARVRFLFRRCLCREPTAEESALLRDYVRRQRESFSTDAAAARAAAGEGPETGAGVVEAAAWSAAARVVMNLDEFITRE